MVHDRIGHYDDTSDTGVVVVLDKDKTSGCPMHLFKFRKTLERPNDDSYENFRTMWWGASFLYDNNKTAAEKGCARVGGKLNTNDTKCPNTLHLKTSFDAS